MVIRTLKQNETKLENPQPTYPKILVLHEGSLWSSEPCVQTALGFLSDSEIRSSDVRLLVGSCFQFRADVGHSCSPGDYEL